MRKYVLADPAQRRRAEAALRALDGFSERPEQSCQYRLDFTAGGERVAVKQYTSGTLFLQSAGPAGPLFDRLTRAVEGSGNGAPGAPGTSGTSGAGAPTGAADAAALAPITAVPLGKAPGAPSRAPRGASTGVDVARPFDPPWIGSDESGKGDYFGPLVACAVWVDDRTLALLETLGVRDSKALSDAQNRRLAQDVRAVCGDRCAEVTVPPERYNALYDQFRREGKNLNALLAWGHARAIETVLGTAPAANVIVDQFADARYIKERLAAVTSRIAAAQELTIVQMPKAEANLAVAAASVLARDRFLAWLARASREHGFTLPKGASREVEAAARRLVDTHGRDALARVAKLHFKTTAKVLAGQQRFVIGEDARNGQ